MLNLYESRENHGYISMDVRVHTYISGDSRICMAFSFILILDIELSGISLSANYVKSFTILSYHITHTYVYIDLLNLTSQ